MSERSMVTVFDSADRGTFFRFVSKTFQDIWFARYSLNNFVINNLRTRYRKSVLGFLWSLLSPLLSMVVLAFIFSFAFKQDIKTFAIYVLTGLSPWIFMSTSILGGCQAMINAEGFLKKVYIPKLLFPLALVTTESVNFIFSIISLYILALAVGAQLSWTFALLPVVVVITFIFILGWVLIFSILTVYFRDLTHITTVVFQALFYLVPIVYPVEILPENFRWLFFYNPFYYFIVLFRKVIYGTPAMTWGDWLIPAGLALVTFGLGMYILMRRDRELIFRL